MSQQIHTPRGIVATRTPTVAGHLDHRHIPLPVRRQPHVGLHVETGEGPRVNYVSYPAGIPTGRAKVLQPVKSSPVAVSVPERE